ncbi:unnamed protein product [Bursaphelenchus xylophilus]|nr:unnamed protein product [Bursaphelenchus xylophilus]CAG9114245.1 unnamed protein product [Bursaphelenchus xylophilus]
MDESMEPGPSRCDPNIDLPSIDVPPENELREKRKKGLEKARNKLKQLKQRKIKLEEISRNVWLYKMDESMEPGTSSNDPNIDLPSTDVPPENPVHVEVECESQHNVPMGVEIEFRVQIASDKFDGLSKIYVILIILIGTGSKHQRPFMYLSTSKKDWTIRTNRRNIGQLELIRLCIRDSWKGMVERNVVHRFLERRENTTVLETRTRPSVRKMIASRPLIFFFSHQYFKINL